MKITVKDLTLTKHGDGWRLEARCEGPCPASIWYAGDATAPRPDLVAGAFLLPALMRAMHLGAELDFAPRVSELFAHRMRAALVPLLQGFASDILPFVPRVHLRHEEPLDCVACVGSATGMSCGLDSLAAARDLVNLPPGHGLRLVRLAHFDAGNHDAMHTGDPSLLRSPRLRRARACADAMGLPISSVDSNVDEWIPGDFARLHTVRNFSAAHLFGGQVRHYFYANGTKICDTKMGAKDTAYIDAMLIPLMSTEVLTFHQATPGLGAPEKIRLIAGWDIAQSYLNVCYFEDKNCGECEKCLRRMLLLDAAGALPSFSAVFPAGALARQLGWYLGYVQSRAGSSPLHQEIVTYLRDVGYPQLRPLRNRTAWVWRRLQNRCLRLMGQPRRPL